MIYKQYKDKDLNKSFSSNYKIKSNRYHASDIDRDDIKYSSNDVDDLIDDMFEDLSDKIGDLSDMFDDLSDKIHDLYDVYEDSIDEINDYNSYSSPQIFSQPKKEEKSKECCIIKKILNIFYKDK